MLAIKKDQMAVLEAGALKAFETRTLRHLQAYFPAHGELIGEAALRETIRLGWARCVEHGLTPECCARSYIEFMCLLGSGFDTDPLLPWAGALLADRSLIDPLERSDLLYDRAWTWLRQVAPDYENLLLERDRSRIGQELRRINALPDDPVALANVRAVCLRLFRQVSAVFPAKAGLAGDGALEGAAERAVITARRCLVFGERGLSLIALLSFLVGSAFDQDPLLPWVGSTLRDETQPEKQRLDRLVERGLAELQRWWQVELNVVGV